MGAAVAPAARSSCVICSTPRSGSWLLADALEKSGLAGQPQEYARPQLEREYARRWGVDGADVAAFTAAMLRAGTGDGDVFGLKVHWQDFARLVHRLRGAGATGSDRAVLEESVPAPVYIHMSRRDTLRQALSWCRALDSNAWWSVGGDGNAGQGPEGGWDPDFEKVDVLRQLLADHERAWLAFFDRCGIEPVRVVYEDFVEDYEPTVRRVLAALDPSGGVAVHVEAPVMRRQADAVTDRWVAQCAHLDGVGRVDGGGDGGQSRARLAASRPRRAATAAAQPFPRVADALAHRRWVRHTRPFPHVVATGVMRDEVYAELDRAFAEILARGLDAGPDGFARSMPGYDAYGHTFRPGLTGPFSLFTSREWHDVVAGVAGVRATGQVFCGLHHHAPGSGSGGVHNDLNPGWFPAAAGPGEVVLNDHRLCVYASGEARKPGTMPVRAVRGVALLYFLHNPGWAAGDGGELGLYGGADNPVDRPPVAVPPVDNSLVLFECTPHSYHSFVRNVRAPRNSLIMWLHRPHDDVVARWGEAAIVGWGRGRRER